MVTLSFSVIVALDLASAPLGAPTSLSGNKTHHRVPSFPKRLELFGGAYFSFGWPPHSTRA